MTSINEFMIKYNGNWCKDDLDIVAKMLVTEMIADADLCLTAIDFLKAKKELETLLDEIGFKFG